jgi:hypothetical protein
MKRRSRERGSQREKERSRTGIESPKMKRYMWDSEQSKSGTSARSVTEGSSPSCVVESKMKERGDVLEAHQRENRQDPPKFKPGEAKETKRNKEHRESMRVEHNR